MKKHRVLSLVMLALATPLFLTGCQGQVGPQGPQGLPGTPGSNGRGILSIVLTESKGNKDTYTITYTNGSQSTFVVTNGEDGIQGVPGKDGHTPVVTIGSNGNWFVDGVDSGFKAQGPKGDKGEDGKDGRGIKSIVLSSQSDGVSTYTILYTDGTTSSFTVKDGETGEMGPQGIQGIQGEDGHTPVITIGDNGNWFVDGVDSGVEARGPKGDKGDVGEKGDKGDKGDVGEKGDQGEKGDKGDMGVSITKIEKTSSDGDVDTYTITYSDNSTSTFTVTNGKDGKNPVITIGENGNFYIDGVDSGVRAQGDKGDKGDTGTSVTSIKLTSSNGRVDTYTITFSNGETTTFNVTNGKSAYEIYKENHPEYEGTESQWIEDLVNGNLREKYTVKFNTNGGTAVETQKVSYGHLVTRPADDPTKTGYLFDGWYLNGEPFPFNSYQVFDNLSIYAKWKNDSLTVTLDANGGDVEYNTKTITYGVKYVLPTPTRANYTFDGWYCDDLPCPTSGIWDFSKTDITLKARWAGTKITASYQEDENLDFDFTKTDTLVYGSNYALSVPSIKTGDRFVGWALSDGTIVTDEKGQSLKPANFKSNVVLHAIYYIDIKTPNQLINLATKKAGSKELSRTYVVQNDLDFTGMQTQPIANFEGTLDGNGHKMKGLGSPLFASVGRTTTSKAIIKNIVFEDLSADCIVEKVLAATSVTATNIKITSFSIDEANYCNYYGFYKTIGGYGDYKPANVTLNKYYVDDENATVDCGMVYDIEWADNTYITDSYTKCNAKESAFVAHDKFETEGKSLQTTDTQMLTKISYCSNYGDAKYLTNLSSFNCDYSSSNFVKLAINNVINYGNMSTALLASSPYVDVYSSNYYIYDSEYRGRQLPIECTRVLNFGKINMLSFLTGSGSWAYKISEIRHSSKYANFNYLFNAGETTYSTAANNNMVSSFYNFTPLTKCAKDGGLEVTSYSQINSDFFENTFGLNAKIWNLDYINIKEEYGLPTIRY